MKFGVSALHVATHAGFAKAGISRYAIEWIGAMARNAPTDRFEIFPPADFSMPVAWSGIGNLAIRPVRRTRTHLATLGVRGVLGGYDWWLNPAYDMLPRTPVPEAAVIHDLYAITNPEWFDGSTVDAAADQIRRACGEARLLLANSEATRQDILRNFKRCPEDVVTIYCGPGNVGLPVQREQVSKADRVQWGIPDAPYFLTVGTLEPRKNIPALLAGYRALVADLPDCPHLAIAGGKGWEFDPIFESMKAWDLDTRVHFLGYVPDEAMPALYACAEGFIFPSLSEGFGIPLLEAMIYGVPAAAANRGSLPEVAGDAALLFDPLSTAGITEALRALLARSASREEWVVKGRLQAEQFSWERVAQATLAALEERTP